MTEDVLTRIIHGVGAAVAALDDYLGDGDALSALLIRLGHDVTADLSPAVSTFAPLSADLRHLSDVVTALAATSDPVTAAQDVVAATEAIGDVVTRVRNMAAAPPAGLPPPFDDSSFWDQFGKDILAVAVRDALAASAPAALGILETLGLAAPATELDAPDPDVARLLWSAFPRLFTDPGALVRDTYGWGTNLDAPRLVRALMGLSGGAGIGAALDADPAVLTAYWSAQSPDVAQPLPVQVRLFDQLAVTADTIAHASLSLGVIPIPDEGSTTGAPTGLAVVLAAEGDLPSGPIALGAGWAATAAATATADVRAELRPSGVRFVAPDAAATLSVGVAGQPPMPWTLGDPAGTHLHLDSISASLAATAGTSGPDEVVVSVSLAGGAAIDTGQADGFLSTVLGGRGAAVTVAVTLRWSSVRGLTFTGGVGVSAGSAGGTPAGQLRVVVPVHQRVAEVLTVDSLTVAARPESGGAIVSATLTGALTLGPLNAVVDGLGVGLAVCAPGSGDAPGNLGLLDVAIRFVPPSGIGLSVQSGLVTGGGYLASASDASGYGGALQVKVAGIGVAAVGQLTTRMPGGAPGFSLIVALSATFPPIEIGFGFAVTGIGGLVGINRTVDRTALVAGIAAGGLDAILFPADVVKNAPAVIAGLGRNFPAAAGQYVIGPSLQVVWGAGGILTISLGVFVEFPNPVRVLVLGKLVMTLPTAAASIAHIEVDIVGTVDFTNKQLALDAVLTHSTLAGFTLTGSAAVRAAWGNQPSFLAAFGGFNPAFHPPASFPALTPITLALSGSANPRIKATAYLAITSNTVQFGGALDVHAALDLAFLGTLAIDASLRIDALIQFHPFGFVLDLAVSVTLSWNGKPVLAVALTGHLAGPSPWQVQATAAFTVCGIKGKVAVAWTSGHAAAIAPASPQSLVELVAAELGKASNWLAGGSATKFVSLRPAVQSATALHPLGALSVRQRSAPLDTTLDKIGDSPISGPTAVSIVAASLGDGSVSASQVTESFARAAYLNLTDAQRLSAPSFDAMPAGAALADDTLHLASSGGTTLYRTVSAGVRVVLAHAPDAPAAAPVALPDDVAATQLAGATNASASGPIPTVDRADYATGVTAPVAVRPTTYTVARNLVPVAVADHTRSEAQDAAAASATAVVATYTSADAARRDQGDTTLRTVAVTEALDRANTVAPVRLATVTYAGPATGARA